MSLGNRIKNVWFNLTDKEQKSLNKINKERINCKSIKDYIGYICILSLFAFILGFTIGFSMV